MNWRSSHPQRPPAWYAASQAALYGIPPEQAEQFLHEVEARYLPPRPAARQRAQFRQRLHLEELMLARACAQGHELAWEEFWRRYPQRLRASARSLTHDSARAEELADGLIGDLFGLATRDGARVSKLSSYMGLGSLEAWLFTLLAQAHVNLWRQQRRQVSLEECDPLRTLLVPPNQEQPAAPAALRRSLEAALAATLAAVDAPVRLLLSLYFLDGQTLAQIATLLRVHESTVSRRLDRALGQLRRQTRRELGRQGLRPAATDAAMHLDPRWLRVDVRRSLQTQPGSSPHGI